MGWSRKCEKRGKNWLRAAALGVVFLWTAGSSLQAEAESSKSAHWHKGVGVEAWLTGADKEQVSQNAASKNGRQMQRQAQPAGRKRVQRPTVRTAKPKLRPAMERKWMT